ncbi:ABC transporter permease [Pseudomonas sp. C2L11]|uniref:ABC transporter permease n=1 Tax=Pseudomonas typographi TaxID=2715964 RepID=A0ABR7YYF0_9PSED|nr:ABC transporter permease [Pseudomonas typographi]MBD1598232.1 ABC transporter permease [Pseudomonas typographi]
MEAGVKAYRGWLLPLVALGAWWLASEYGWSRSGLWVSPQQVLATAIHEVASGHLWVALGASLARDLSGFAIGAGLGLALGCVLGLSALGNRLLGPSFNTFKQVSLFAWIPLISVWFGLGDVAKVVFLSLAALVPVVVNTADGLRNVPLPLLEVARVYGYSRWQSLTLVRLPAALPSIFTGLYLGLIYSWLATIGAEYLLVSGEGIGNTLIDGSEHFRMDLVLFGMLVIGTVGWLLNSLARLAERRLQRLYGTF